MTMQAELGNKIETLTAHEATLTMELGNLSTQAKRVGEQLDQIQSALSSLRDGKSSGKHPLRNGGPVQKKRTTTPAIIQEIVTIALGKQDRLLFDQVKSELLARGLSRVGVKSLLADAIRKPAFTVNSDQTVSVN
tara:strand:+ start:2629 stop:3033 length:405 start_codon:yes stop_codon:yes gene_type:complete